MKRELDPDDVIRFAMVELRQEALGELSRLQDHGRLAKAREACARWPVPHAQTGNEGEEEGEALMARVMIPPPSEDIVGDECERCGRLYPPEEDSQKPGVCCAPWGRDRECEELGLARAEAQCERNAAELAALRLEVAAWRALVDWQNADHHVGWFPQNGGVHAYRRGTIIAKGTPAAVASKLQLIPAEPDAESSKGSTDG